MMVEQSNKVAILWYYTTGEELLLIIRHRKIKPATASRRWVDVNQAKPAVWFFSNQY